MAFPGIKNQDVTVNMDRHLVQKELTLIESWASTVPEHFEIIELMRQRLPVDGLVTHRFGMHDAPIALVTFFEGKAVKSIIHPWASAQF